MTTDLFMVASQESYRYPSKIGELTTEQLWSLPLQARNGHDLDTVAKTINAELKDAGEESFVNSAKSNPARRTLSRKLDIVKAVIEVKEAQAAARAEAKSRESERERLREALADRENQELRNLSSDELKARLAQLGG